MDSSARRIGRPTTEGKTCSGKLEPAKPTLTNYFFVYNNQEGVISIKHVVGSCVPGLRAIAPVPGAMKSAKETALYPSTHTTQVHSCSAFMQPMILPTFKESAFSAVPAMAKKSIPVSIASSAW